MATSELVQGRRDPETEVGHNDVTQSVQRDDPAPAAATPGEAKSATPGWDKTLDIAQSVRGGAQERGWKAGSLAKIAVGLDGQGGLMYNVTNYLGSISAVYSSAYADYAKVIAAAQARAQAEEEWIDIGMSIVIAVAIGSGVGWLAGIAKVGEGVAVEAIKEAITASSTEFLGKPLVKATGVFEVAGKNLQPAGLTPAAQQLELWKQLVNLYQWFLQIASLANSLGTLESGAEFAIGEIKAQMGGGAGAELPVADLQALISRLSALDSACKPLDASLEGPIQHVFALKEALEAAESPGGRQQELERDIWILWIAELSEEDERILDKGPIQDRLESLGLISSYYGAGGTLGVDTGIWTTKNDRLKMIAAAKPLAEHLKSNLSKLSVSL